MKKILACVLSLAILLSMCAMPAMAENSAYRTLYSGEITSLNYLTTATTNEFALAANVIDTLVEYDKYGQVQPSLAESWEYDAENLTYTFNIRKGAKWVKADGSVYADVTAHDFVTAAKYILDAANASSTANIFYSVIEGAEAYYLGTSEPEEGKEPYPVSRKSGEILRKLLLKGIERLKNLFKGSRSRSEVVATFIAILDMCKNNTVTLEDDVTGENPNVRLLDTTLKEEAT